MGRLALMVKVSWFLTKVTFLAEAMADVHTAKSSRYRRQSFAGKGENYSAASGPNINGLSRADRSVDGTSDGQHHGGIFGALAD